MPYFEQKNGEMYSADSPFWPLGFIVFRVNGRYWAFLSHNQVPPTPNCFNASEISWNANVT